MKTNKVKQLIKILIGAAWIDGKIQPEERTYLHHIVQENALEEDDDILPLLNELRVVEPEECYNWITDYLGENPQPEDYQELIEAISGLIYSDGEVATAEAQLLSRLQLLANDTQKSPTNSIINTIQKLYRRWTQIQ